MTLAARMRSARGGPLAVRPGFVRVAPTLGLAAAALLATPPPAPASPAVRGALADSAAAILGDAPARATWGILAVSLDRGDTLLALDPERRLIPGSNQKLLTLGAFLARHGAGYRGETGVLARGKARVKEDGRRVELTGDLVLRGSGLPDVWQLLAPGSRGLLDSLAFRLAAGGLSKFEGTLWVDGSLFARAPYPRGWEVEDLPHGYGAPVNAILANGNAASVVAEAGPSGARVRLDPADAPLSLSGVVAVGENASGGWLRVDREPGSRVVLVAGLVPRGSTIRRTVSLPEPDSAAGVMLLGAMRRAGIEVNADVRVDVESLRAAGGWVSGDPPLKDRAGAGDPPGTRAADRATARAPGWDAVGERRFTTVLAIATPPARDLATAVAAHSLNPECEALLRLLDPAPRGKSPEAALRELAAALAAAGIDSAEVSLVDGSGLSPQNLATPRALVRWLTHLDRAPRPGPGVFAEVLPAPGAPGTLERRFGGLPSDPALRAKTGTLTNVSALSGYVTTRGGERVAFSILSNGNRGSTAGARATEEALVGVLSRYAPSPVPARPVRRPAWGIPR